MSKFQENLKVLADKYSQKYIASKTGFSQSSINNYLTKSSEPSIQFLIALKNAFGICLDDFLFSNINIVEEFSYNRFLGHYIVYYYNNSSYKGEVHTNLANTLNYGVISIVQDGELNKSVSVFGTFFREKSEAIKLLKNLKSTSGVEQAKLEHEAKNNFYTGNLKTTDQSIFIDLYNNVNSDQCYIILNNPPSKMEYVGGVGTVNTVARGREHNPCIEFMIMSKRILDKSDGEIYECLKFDDYNVNLDYAVKDVVELFKRLYSDQNELSTSLQENQKMAIIQNKLEYHFNEILDANVFRFAKVSNKEDDLIFKLIKEGVDV